MAVDIFVDGHEIEEENWLFENSCPGIRVVQGQHQLRGEGM